MEKYFEKISFGPYKGKYEYNGRIYESPSEIIPDISEPHEIKIFDIAGIRDFSSDNARENSQKCFALSLGLEAINPAEAERALALAAQFESVSNLAQY